VVSRQYEVKPSCHPSVQKSSHFFFTFDLKYGKLYPIGQCWKLFMTNPTSHKITNILEHVTLLEPEVEQLIFVRKSGQRSINTNMTAVILTILYLIPNVKKKWDDNWPLPSIFSGYVIYPKPYKIQAKGLFGMTTGFYLVGIPKLTSARS
jgi:hypothetical protein